MGVYYYFYNKEIINNKIINNYGLSFIAKFDSFNESNQIRVFKDIIKINLWDENDTIVAKPDYNEYNIIIYNNGIITIVNRDYSSSSDD